MAPARHGRCHRARSGPVRSRPAPPLTAARRGAFAPFAHLLPAPRSGGVTHFRRDARRKSGASCPDPPAVVPFRAASGGSAPAVPVSFGAVETDGRPLLGRRFNVNSHDTGQL